MMSTMEADEDWWPPTFTPVVFCRPRLAASTIAVANHSTRRETSRSTGWSVDEAGERTVD